MIKYYQLVFNYHQKHVIFRASAAMLLSQTMDLVILVKITVMTPNLLFEGWFRQCSSFSPEGVFHDPIPHADTRKVRIAIRMTPKIQNGCFWGFLVLFGAHF